MVQRDFAQDTRYDRDTQKLYSERICTFFATLSHRTGVYRFKYKVARQLGQLVLLGRLRRTSNVQNVRNALRTSPDAFLQIYCHQLRSLAPLLEGYLKALVGRMVCVRAEKAKTQRPTAQRVLNTQLKAR